MNESQQVAYVQAMSAGALIEAMGMQAENSQRAIRGESPAYAEKQFSDLINKWGIHHNAVLSLFQGV